MIKSQNVFIALLSFLVSYQNAYTQAVCVSPQTRIDLVTNLAGVESWDLRDDPDNVVITICDVGLANQRLTHIAWENVVFNTLFFSNSWCSEASIGVSLDVPNPGNGVIIQPNAGNDAPGMPCPTATSDGFIELASIPADVFADASGCITIQFFETFDDDADDFDGTFASGTLTLSGCGVIRTIPTIGEWGVIVLCLLLSIGGTVCIKNTLPKLGEVC